MPRLSTLLALPVLTLLASGPAAAEAAYPSRPTQLIVPFVPGVAQTTMDALLPQGSGASCFMRPRGSSRVPAPRERRAACE